MHMRVLASKPARFSQKNKTISHYFVHSIHFPEAACPPVCPQTHMWMHSNQPDGAVGSRLRVLGHVLHFPLIPAPNARPLRVLHGLDLLIGQCQDQDVANSAGRLLK